MLQMKALRRCTITGWVFRPTVLSIEMIMGKESSWTKMDDLIPWTMEFERVLDADHLVQKALLQKSGTTLGRFWPGKGRLMQNILLNAKERDLLMQTRICLQKHQPLSLSLRIGRIGQSEKKRSDKYNLLSPRSPRM